MDLFSSLLKARVVGSMPAKFMVKFRVEFGVVFRVKGPGMLACVLQSHCGIRQAVCTHGWVWLALGHLPWPL
jgi:hypothetical protein